jgi:Lamin Tail Domain/CARDB
MGKIFLFILLLLPAACYGQEGKNIILSEIMFDPQSSNNEFIEIYNLSETESVDLNGFKIKYQTSNPDMVESAGSGTVLRPKSFAVIFEGDYDIAAGIYKDIIPAYALILKIGDNSFGTSGMSNGSDRTIFLLNTSDDTLETYTYSANNNSGISDEKIILNNDDSPSNWLNSSKINGTPGFINSVTPLKYDLTFTSILVSPVTPIKGENVNINFTIKNNGAENAGSYSIEVYNDINNDSSGSESELIYENNFSNLNTGDSNLINIQIQSVNEGEYNLIAKIIFTEDEDSTNNIKYFQFKVYPPGNNYNDVVINEIMYAPSNDEPEWIELFNTTSSPINIKNWSISDASSKVQITAKDKFINANSFLIISKDSSVTDFYSIPSEVVTSNIPTLNNSGDAVIIKDSLNILIDSLIYSPSWGGNIDGNSLERISADNESNNEKNWGTCKSINKATPGKINSLSPKNYDLAINFFKPEKEYGILNEPIFFDLVVKNPGLKKSSNFTVKIFNDVNKDSINQNDELIMEFNGNQLEPGDSSNFKFNIGNISKGQNYFIALIEIQDDENLENNFSFSEVNGIEINEVRGDIIINEIMYAPINGEPEWIELYNRSSKTVDLKNYSVADTRDTIRFINNSVLIKPDEYFIFADDSTITDFYNLISGYQINNLPSLNNNGDRIVLLDSIYRVIDSLEYSSPWGGSDGKSLERIDPDKSSADSSNWAASKDKLHGTPGKINSITQKDFDILAKEILYDPQFPQAGDDINISVKINNIGKNSAEFKIEFYEDTNLDSLPDALIFTSAIYNLAAGDSIIIPIDYIINNLQQQKGVYCSAVFTQDQDSSNNSIYSVIEPGFPAGSIIINEIMYNPSGGEPEWIELFNTTNYTINLNKWIISDVVTTPAKSIINGNYFIDPKSYLVISKDSSIINYHRQITAPIITNNLPVLNNDEDGVVLSDDRMYTIDSVFYNKDWGGNSHSLERISYNASSNLSSNWGSSIDIELSTPGRINSITSKTYDLSISKLSFIPQFPVPGDNVFFSAKIKNNGTKEAAFSVYFYSGSDSSKANQLLSVESNINLNPNDSSVLTSSNSIKNLRKKILTAVKIDYQNDQDTLNNYVEKLLIPGIKRNVLLINEVMYSPANDEPEWIEFVNVSEDTLNLKDWMIGDLLPKPSKHFITNEDYFLNPGEYFLAAQDQIFLNNHPDYKGKIKFINFGTLGNSEDGIIVYDFREGIIDSLYYKSSWGGNKGYSLERISLNKETNDSSNWSSSLSENKSTPGLENSLLNIPGYKKNDLIINEIMFDPDVNNSEFIELFNSSNSNINIGGWKVEDGNGNFYKLSDVSFVIPANNFFVLAADSQIFNNYNKADLKYITILNSGSLSLSKSGDEIILKDTKGNLIDSVFYSEKWHNENFVSTKNISLEKINPLMDGNNSSNWSSSVNSARATPGKVNSIYSENKNTNEKISISPNPFSPDNDGFEDFTIINYNLSQNTSEVRIEIFDSKGRLLRTLLNNQPSGSKGSVIFDGLEENGRPLRLGIYIVLLEALNETSGISETLKTEVVVARKL